MADWAAQESAARNGLTCATRAGDDTLRLQALRLVASARVMQGYIDEGQALALRGLAEAKALGLRSVEARLLNTLAAVALMRDDVVGALDLSRQGLSIHRETGDRVNEAIALSNLGRGWLALGDLPQARRELDTALLLARANGDRVVEGSALCKLSTLALWQGDETRALALARTALEIAMAAQARDDEVLAGLALGDAELTLGRTAAARQAYAQAHRVALEIDLPLKHDTNTGLALVALADGDTAAALAALQPVLDLVAAGGGLDSAMDPRRIEWACHQTLARAGDPRAAVWLARAHAALMAEAEAISRHSPGTQLHQGFLQNIPHHRATVAAWAARDTAGGSPTPSTG